MPNVIPITDQYSLYPNAYAAPGKPNNNHADSADALSENAVTQGPSLRPANKKSS